MMDGIGPIRVLVLETEPEAANHARDALAGDERMLLVGTVTDQASLLDKLGATYAQVAVVDLAGLRGEIGPAVREILSRAPECCVPRAPLERLAVRPFSRWPDQSHSMRQ